MKYHDISPTISSRLGVFPGDRGFSRVESMNFAQGHHLRLSHFETTVHLGAHVDSPGHYHRDGKGIESRSLEYYFGLCQVIRVDVARGKRIMPADLVKKRITETRVLFYTGSFPDPERWNSDFCALSPELVHLLADQGVKLVGIDTPSIDPESSKELESHSAVYVRDLAVLEGIVLNDVAEGIYQLVALPLKIEGADASPVRAILIEPYTL